MTLIIIGFIIFIISYFLLFVEQLVSSSSYPRNFTFKTTFLSFKSASMCVCDQLLNYVQLCGPMEYVACQAPLSMEFSSQDYWSPLPFPPRGDLPNPGTEPVSCVFTTSTTWEALASIKLHIIIKKILNLLFAFIPSSYFLFYI